MTRILISGNVYQLTFTLTFTGGVRNTHNLRQVVADDLEQAISRLKTQVAGCKLDPEDDAVVEMCVVDDSKLLLTLDKAIIDG